MKRHANAAESRHMSRVAELGCYLCRRIGYGPTPAQVHHLRDGEGMAQRGSHWLTVPLCERHHANSSPDGIHGGRAEWKRHQADEWDALADTIQRLMT